MDFEHRHQIQYRLLMSRVAAIERSSCQLVGHPAGPPLEGIAIRREQSNWQLRGVREDGVHLLPRHLG